MVCKEKFRVAAGAECLHLNGHEGNSSSAGCPDSFATGQVQHMLLSVSALPPTGTVCTWKGSPENLIFTKTTKRNHFCLLIASSLSVPD